MKSAPAFQFYVNDWLSPGDVRRMTAEQRGVYIDLLAYSWDKGGIPPDDIENPTMLSRLTGVSVRKFKVIWGAVQHKFTTDSRGFRVNNRLELCRSDLAKYSRSQSEKATKRWGKPIKPATDVMPRDIPDVDAGLCSLSLPLSLPLSSKKRKTRSAQARPAIDLPFTADDLIATLHETSAGVIPKEFDGRLRNPLHAAIAQFKQNDLSLDDVRLLGRYIGAGALEWPRDPDARWLSANGNLIGAICKAKAWNTNGGKSRMNNPQTGRFEPKPGTDYTNTRI